MHMRIWSSAAALFLAAALGGCETPNINPVTGNPIYTRVSSATEDEYGRKLNAEMIAAYGVYQDAQLTAYVDRVGQALAKNVVRKDVHYTFTILEDDDNNAFALPGGYVYITRGALNFANSEAELAAILAHEIGHVDAFHFNGGERDTMSGVLSVLLQHSSTDADELAMARSLAEKATKSSGFSKPQEFEADALSIHYLTLAGYDPEGMVAALRTEQAKTLLDDGMKGNPIAHDIFALDDSHPATPDRAARAEAAVKAEAAKMAAPAPGVTPQTGVTPRTGANLKTDRDAYLAAIDGMVFGVDPGEGMVEGRRLVNPALGFSFEAPKDFDLWTSHDGAFGVGRNAVLILEATDKYAGQSMVTYVQSSITQEMTVDNVRPLEIAGYRGAAGTVTMDPFVIRVGAVHDRGNRIYQLMYMTTRRAFGDQDSGFLDSLKSFRPLDAAEAKAKPAPRLHIVTVAKGDTVKSLAERMAVPEKKLEWFRVLNGMAAGDEVKAGDKVKVVEGK